METNLSDNHAENNGNNNKLSQALAYREAGFSVTPVDTDGSKSPCYGFKWKRYSTRQPTASEIESWFDGINQDIAIIGGAVSGNLAILDFDEKHQRGIFERWKAAVDPAILAKLAVIVR